MGVIEPTLRLRNGGRMLECAQPRRRRPDVDCDTPICTLYGDRLIIRCRNCASDHTFIVRDGRIEPLIPISPAHALRHAGESATVQVSHIGS